MDELKRMLGAKADEIRVGPNLPVGLRTRARRKRIANATVAAAVVGAVGFGSFTGFRFALEQTSAPRPVTPAQQGQVGEDSENAEEPRTGPTPGPTPTSDHATPAPISVQVDVASPEPGLLHYVEALLRSEGIGPAHGGYTLASARETEGSEVTVVFHRPGSSSEAARLERLLFPGAEIRAMATSTGVPLRIVVGADFVEQDQEHLEALRVATAFMWARVSENRERAEVRLSDEAAALYRERHGGLDLYTYAEGAVFDVTGVYREGPSTRVIVRMRQPREDQPHAEAYETLIIGDELGDGRQEVLFAERNS